MSKFIYTFDDIGREQLLSIGCVLLKCDGPCGAAIFAIPFTGESNISAPLAQALGGTINFQYILSDTLTFT